MSRSAIDKIRTKLHLRVIGFGGALSLILIVSGHLNWVPSVWVGIFFSALIFTSITRQNERLRQTKSKIPIFYGLLSRLALYGGPIILAFTYPAYLNIFVLLICLIAYQFHYVIFELTYQWKHYKKRTD